MALIVEDGTGLPEAESYADVDRADAYHASRANAAWATAYGMDVTGPWQAGRAYAAGEVVVSGEGLYRTVEDGVSGEAPPSHTEGEASDGGVTWLWLDRADAYKEALLRRATYFIEGRFGPRFRGRRALAAQALSWPRRDALDDGGWTILGVPAGVVEAVCEAALLALEKDLEAPAERGGGLRRQWLEGVGGREYDPGSPAGDALPSVEHRLAGLLESGLTRRVVRS